SRARVLQKILYEGGFAGICFPKEYGGLGLTPDHQRAFTEESMGYEMPMVLNMPTFGICAPTILDMGTEEQKRKHLPAVIRGDEQLVQFLSEPQGGSDLAGLTTRAERDGDVWILNGSKIWSSGAYAADYELCLERNAVGGGSPYFSGDRPRAGGEVFDLVDLARRTGQLDDSRVREDIGEARAMRIVERQLIDRMARGIETGAMQAPASSII